MERTNLYLYLKSQLLSIYSGQPSDLISFGAILSACLRKGVITTLTGMFNTDSIRGGNDLDVGMGLGLTVVFLVLVQPTASENVKTKIKDHLKGFK